MARAFALGFASASGFGAGLAITLCVGEAGAGQWIIVGSALVFALLAP